MATIGSRTERLNGHIGTETRPRLCLLYTSIWDVYCDWYIEIAKLRLNSEDAAEADSARQILVSVLVQALKLLHPFMPFIKMCIRDRYGSRAP